MTFAHVNRRLHLYLALALVPWFLMYGLSSVPFAHARVFDALDALRGLPQWTLRFERALDVPAPATPDGYRPFGRVLLDEAGIHGMSYGVYRQGPNQINVYAFSFWKSTQLLYFTDRKTLRVEDRRFRWDHFLTGMHARGGFDQEGVVVRSWSVVVDLVQIAILVWVATGLLMWWELPGHRLWGALAISAGVTSSLLFTTWL